MQISLVNYAKTVRGTKCLVPVKSKEELFALCDSKKQKDNVVAIREKGDQTKKGQLLQLNFQCPTFNSDGMILKDSTTLSPLFQHDIDCAPSDSDRIAQQILARKDELRLAVLKRTANKGLHAVAWRVPGTTILENQVRMATALKTEFDNEAHDAHRILYSCMSEDFLFIDESIFSYEMTQEEAEADYKAMKEREQKGEEVLPEGAHKANKHYRPWEHTATAYEPAAIVSTPTATTVAGQTVTTTFAKNDEGKLLYRGIIAYEDIIAKWNEMYYDGNVPCDGDRHVRILELARHFRCLTDYQASVLDAIIPNYPDSKGNAFPQDEKMRIIKDALAYKLTGISSKVRKVLEELRVAYIDTRKMNELINETQDETDKYYANLLRRCFNTKSIQCSLEGIPSDIHLQALFGILAFVGGIASNVRLYLEDHPRHLILLIYVCGKSGSGKNNFTELYKLWCHNLMEQDKVIEQQEDEWESEQRLAALSQNKEPRKELRLPHRLQAARTSVPKLLKRLRDAKGLMLITFMPESDILSENPSFFKTAKVLLRLAFDEDEYKNDVQTVQSTNVTISHVLWQVIMCGTRDALERLIAGNYRDGVSNRISCLKMPDNTFKKFKVVRPRSEKSKQYIYHVARLLNLMKGDLVLPRLEARGKQWADNVCDEAAAVNDEPMAALRLRSWVSAARALTALLLCKYADKLIAQLDNRGSKELPSWADGCTTAEEYLKKHPETLQKHINQLLTADMLNCYDAMADNLLDTALYFFRSHMETDSMNTAHSEGQRHRRGLNDGIFNQLKEVFTNEDAAELKGGTPNAVRQMLKNWENCGYIEPQDDGTWKKQVASL